jgi:predicted homoserine dehydrogenase-like protein
MVGGRYGARFPGFYLFDDEMSAHRYLPEGLVEGCRLTRDIKKDSGHRL